MVRNHFLNLVNSEPQTVENNFISRKFSLFLISIWIPIASVTWLVRFKIVTLFLGFHKKLEKELWVKIFVNVFAINLADLISINRYTILVLTTSAADCFASTSTAFQQ